MKKYIAIINFKIEIEAENMVDAENIAATALPTKYQFTNSTGQGKYLRGLPPVVFANDVEKESKLDSYWNNK